MTVVIKSSHATAQVDHIFVPKTKYQPGDTVDVGVVIKPYKEDSVLKHISLVIPQTVPDGSVTLVVRGGGAASGSTISFGGTTIVLRPSAPAGPPPSNVTQLVHQFLDQPKNNELVASLQLPTSAVSVQGESLSLLPPTMLGVMRSTRTTGLRLARDEVKTNTQVAWVLTGSQTLTLTVARKNTLDNASPSGAPASDTSSTDTSATSSDSTTTDSTPSDSSSSDSNSSDSSSSARSTMSYQPDDAPAVLTAPETAIDAVPVALAPSKPPAASGPATASTPATDAARPADVTETTSTSGGDVAPKTKPKPVGRLATVWRQSGAADFTAGTLDDTTITSANDLRLALSLRRRAVSTSAYVWSLTTDAQGGLYAGTGDEGIVYKVGVNGTMTPFFRTKELEVTSLVSDPATGALYAGTSPHGAVFRITPDGQGVKIFSAPEKYITALALDKNQNRLYAATGGGAGKVYALPLTGKGGKVFFTSQETHLLSLAVDKQGTVYAGGAPDGVLYSITPDGKGSVLYDAAQANITSLAAGGDGSVYAGTSPFGVLYKITPGTGTDGFGAKTVVKSLAARPKTGVSSIQIDALGNVWAAAGDSVYCVTPDNTAYTYAAPTDVTLLSLAMGPSGQVYAGTGSSAEVYALGGAAGGNGKAFEGTYTSPVHDAKHPAIWGTVTWSSVTPEGTHLTIQTRSGDVPRPDETWSQWLTAYTEAAGQKIQSPPARYLQYRASFTSDDPQPRSDAMPRLSSVSLYYLTQNQAPAVKMAAPANGDVVSGTTTIRWNGYDPDHDTLAYDVFYSSDGGKTFLPLPKNASSTQSTSSAATGTASAPDDAARGASLSKELDKHPEIPAAVRAQMLQQAALMRAGDAAASASTTTASHLATTSLPWDTHAVPDGSYILKVVASDAQSNPTDAKTGDSRSSPFLVVNTPPVLTVDPQGVLATTADPNGITRSMETLHGLATAKLCFIRAVQYRVDGSKDAYAAAPDDGLFDSGNEPFTITIDTKGMASGTHQVTVEAFDQAGNVSKTLAAFVLK